MSKTPTILLLLFALVINNSAIFAPVSVEKAKTVALNILKNIDNRLNAPLHEVVYTMENAFLYLWIYI